MATGFVVRQGGLVLQRFSQPFGKAFPFTLRPLPVCAACVPHLFQNHRLYSVSKQKNVGDKDSAAATTDIVSVDHTDVVKEKFIPITRRSMVRHLMQEKNYLTPEELRKFEGFSLALDSAIVNKYHGVLQELKSLFDPINPDKDTISTRQWNRRERMDNEFWLIQKLAAIMEKANFRELPRALVEKAMAEHQSREGVMVSVDTDKYDILRFWALGRETPKEKPSLTERVVSATMRRPLPAPLEYYKRVVVAVRLKRDDKLILKAFKEVPVNALEQLLPDGKIKMTKFDQGLMTFTTSIAAIGVLAKLVTYLAHIQVDWTLIITAVTGLVGFNAWSTYKNRRNYYLLDLNRMLYFKNIANNRGLLALLVDRAEDELFKEVLLVYTFLLATRPPSVVDKESADQLPAELGGLTQNLLENKVQDWVHRKTGSPVQFVADDAVHVLTDLGIISSDYNAELHVLPLDGALRNLPITPQTLTARKEEHDIVEGYDRDISEETLEEYKKEEKQRKRFGWSV